MTDRAYHLRTVNNSMVFGTVHLELYYIRTAGRDCSEGLFRDEQHYAYISGIRFALYASFRWNRHPQWDRLALGSIDPRGVDHRSLAVIAPSNMARDYDLHR